jgi:hypothetical protein
MLALRGIQTKNASNVERLVEHLNVNGGMTPSFLRLGVFAVRAPATLSESSGFER